MPHPWFGEYLDALDRRAQALEKRYAHDVAALEWLAEQRREVEIARCFTGFGYVIYVTRRSLST
jgi:hypothetical protein